MFSSVQSETDMLRYLRKLADKDLALDRTMIPLGSWHHEAERHGRDDPHHVAGVRADPPVRAGVAKPGATTS